MPTKKDDVVFRHAIENDIESMTTMVPRAFAPEAPLPISMPNTVAVREWWAQTYKVALQDPSSHLLVAVDGDKTVGVLTLHYFGPDSPPTARSAIIAAIPMTSDHSPELAGSLKNLKEERTKLMGGDPHFLIELVGVDQDYKDVGIGRELVRRACEVADERDAAIFLQTTAARDYYTKKLDLGFVQSRAYGDSRGGTVIRPRKSKVNAASHSGEESKLQS